jgi:hypothetical protein
MNVSPLGPNVKRSPTSVVWAGVGAVDVAVIVIVVFAGSAPAGMSTAALSSLSATEPPLAPTTRDTDDALVAAPSRPPSAPCPSDSDEDELEQLATTRLTAERARSDDP